MSKSERAKLVVSLVLLLIATVFMVRFLRQTGGTDEAFFYDLSEQKLFTAPRTAVPPIKGLNDDKEDAVRAVVVSTTGNPREESSWKVVYLEMYSPELKRQMEAAQATGTSPEMGRGGAQSHRFVRRVGEDQWHAMNSSEGERIVTEWAAPGENGVTPVVCTP